MGTIPVSNATVIARSAQLERDRRAINEIFSKLIEVERWLADARTNISTNHNRADAGASLMMAKAKLEHAQYLLLTWQADDPTYGLRMRDGALPLLNPKRKARK